MDIQVRPIDPHDDAELAAFQGVYERAVRRIEPAAVPHSLAETRALLTLPSSAFAYEAMAAFEDGFGHERLVGAAFLIARLTDNSDRASVHLHVEPGSWGRGIGSVLAREVDRMAGQRNWRFLDADFAIEPDLGQVAFAEHRGWRLNNIVIERRMTLAERRPPSPTVDAPYRIETIVGPIPDDRREGYANVLNRMNLDAPQGNRDLAVGARTAQAIAEQDDELCSSGRTRVTALAMRGEQVVGISCVIADHTETARQWGTLVLAAHRGHRLGFAMKLATAAALAAHAPQVDQVVTTNVETNAPMVAINEQLGFVITGRHAEFTKRLG